MCGAKHMAKDKSAADCTRECVKMGSEYALVVGNTVYRLKGDKAAIDKFVGQKFSRPSELARVQLQGERLRLGRVISSCTGVKAAKTRHT